MTFLIILAVLGLVGGFFSGLLGLGGAILMVPLLLFVPPMLGFPALDMKVVSAISIVQVTFASLAAVLVHARNNYVSKPLVTLMGVTGALTSFAGGFFSKEVHASTLLLIFAVISSLAALMMFIPRREVESDVPADKVKFSWPLAVAIAAVVGLIGGLIGAPGAFIYVPLLMYVLGIPTRITLGSTLAIVLISSISGLVGKLLTGQVPLGMSVALVIGAIPGARWGGAASKRFNVKTLKWLVTAVVVTSTLKVWGQVLPPGALSTPTVLYGVAVLASVAVVGLIFSRSLTPLHKPQFRLFGDTTQPKGETTMPTMVRPGSITPAEVQQLIEAGKAPKIIDVREDEEVDEGTIPGAVHIPLGQFQSRLSELDPKEEAVIVCRSGNQSSRACEAAARAGYRVRNFEGGMLAWHGPVERRTRRQGH